MRTLPIVIILIGFIFSGCGAETKFQSIGKQDKRKINRADVSTSGLYEKGHIDGCPSTTQNQGDYDISFVVTIISGSIKGQCFSGGFDLKKNSISNNSTGEIQVELYRFEFFYKGETITLENFDPLYKSRPTAVFANGHFIRLVAVGGAVAKRFGFNGGFNRFQFGRPSEMFIQEGKDYFGYLDPDTFVDGAGTIKYQEKSGNSGTNATGEATCYWMENYSGQFKWVDGQIGFYRDGGKQQCYALDSCDGGLGQSGGGCYKWAISPAAPRIAWDKP